MGGSTGGAAGGSAGGATIGGLTIDSLTLALIISGAILLLYVVCYLIVTAKKKVAVVAPEVKEEVAESVKEEAEQEKVVKAKPVAKKAVAVTKTEDELGDDRDIAKRVPFAEKMLAMDKKTQEYYNELNNMFRAMRKINPRVSSKGVSYRLGRDLVAKITVRGKTMKLHLALDVSAFDWNIYFQKDLKDVKAYQDVPFTVKVKSDRGMKNAVNLVEALMTAKGIEKKTRSTKIDSIEALKKAD